MIDRKRRTALAALFIVKLSVGWLPAFAQARPLCSAVLAPSARPAAIRSARLDLFRRFPEHRAIVEDLKKGVLVGSEPFRDPSGSKSQLFKVRIFNPESGATRTAIFKPRMPLKRGEDRLEDWSRSFMDVLAYRLNLYLEMDVVPPAVYRTGFQVPGSVASKGALILFVENLTPIVSIRDNRGFISPHPDRDPALRRLLADDKVLSILLGDSDRHLANIGYGDHWTTGKRTGISYDFSAALREDAGIRLDTTFDLFRGWEGHDKVNRRTFERLMESREEEILALIKPHVRTAEEQEWVLNALRDTVRDLKDWHSNFEATKDPLDSPFVD